MNKRLFKQLLISFLIGVLVLSLSGCQRIGNFYFSTSLTDTYLAAGHKTSLTTREANLIFMDYQTRYNAYYSRSGIENFWELPVSGYTFSDYLKEKRIKEEICLLLLLNDMAKDSGITLDETEKRLCGQAAKTYYSGLNEIERAYCQAQESDVASLYEKYRTAQKLLYQLTDGIYLEISDNDKRVISIQILSTDNLDLANQLHEQLQAGGDFVQAAREHSLLSKIEYQVSRGMLNPALEEIAFYLADGEVSEVIATDGRYFLIRCVEDFDEELSIANEEEIYRQSLYEQWGPIVEEYAAGYKISFQFDLWSEMTFTMTSAMTNANLFDVYDQYLKTNE